MTYIFFHLIGIILSFIILRAFYYFSGYNWDEDKGAFYLPIIGLGLFATEGIILWILYCIFNRVYFE